MHNFAIFAHRFWTITGQAQFQKFCVFPLEGEMVN